MAHALHEAVMTLGDKTPSQDRSAAAPAALQHLQPLRRAEKVVLQAVRDGEIARVGLRRPLVPSADMTVRGEFISLLARGVVEGVPSHHSLQMLGAWVEGRVDLRDAVVPESLWFYRCTFDGTPRLDGARIGGSVNFPDCLLPGLRAEGCTVTEDLALNSGCTIRTEVRLARASIGRDLNCERLQLRSGERSTSPSRQRLSADGARIDGHAILADGFEADGNVRLVGARIAGDLRADNARMSGKLDSAGTRGDALNLDQCRVAGRVSLDQGFTAAGTVRLAHARIGGDLDCTGATFDMYGEAAYSGQASLRLDRLEVSGSLMLAGLKNPLNAASLLGARVGALLDDASTWGDRLVLDGFHYARFAAGAPTSASFRLGWLAQQEPAHLARDYRPAPWRQLVSVLRNMGYAHDARQVAVERETHLRRIGRVGASAPTVTRWLSRTTHAWIGALTGYGLRPLRLVVAMAAVWLFCSAWYGAAAQHGVMAPTDALVLENTLYARCQPEAATVETQEKEAGNRTRCAALTAVYPAFHPFVYSLDRLLPLVDLQQETRWAAVSETSLAANTTAGATTTPVASGGTAQPSPAWRRATLWLSWFEIAFGWTASLLLAATLTGRLDRNRGDADR